MNLGLRSHKILIALSLTTGGVLALGACSNSEDDQGSDEGSGGSPSVGGNGAGGGAHSGGTGPASGGTGTGNGGSSTGGGNSGGGPPGGGASGNGGDGPQSGGNGGGGVGGTGAGGGGGDGSGGGGSVSVGHRECDGSPFPAVTLTQIMSEGSAPVFVGSPPNDASRIFVADLGGTLRVVNDDGSVVSVGNFPVASAFGEQGFHSFAFHPNFDGTTESRIYLHFNASNGHTRIVETTLTGDTLDTSDFEGKTIVYQEQPDRNHNGGQLQFGPDGYLYISLGDGGNSCDVGHGSGGLANGVTMPDGRASDLSSALGSILRVDVDNLDTFPAGNVDAGGGNDGRILHWGLRNPWRFSFDRGTNDLWIADVGQNAHEELNVLPAGGDGSIGPSTNFGWPAREGLSSSADSSCALGGMNPAGAMEPIIDYGRSNADGGTSITGGYVYRGAAIPALQGRYIYADYNSDNIWTVTWDGSQACDAAMIQDTFDADGVLSGITSFGEDANGELYVAVTGGGGGVYRVDPQ